MRCADRYDLRKGSVGFPLAGVEIKITESGSGETMPKGEIGQMGSVAVRGEMTL
ncbi:hypothetical protein [uncultured Ruegeria sp.]|uniref:hypothetical protein n=1 Tax=uncultured Ruegeria sp. TaxID=259304 RepID=UPI002637C4A1|nr:hypothetical protein [uncultured Ruegeria sp.]